MRVLFMGTPDFAVPSLQKLIDRGDAVCAVVTQPDKPRGRGHQLQPSPVKALALKYGIPVLQPATLKDSEAQAQLAALAPELIVVAAYGKLLPKAVLDLPPLGCVNVHGSLLPKYRGAGPIQWAVLNGERITGVTTMRMGEGMDTGDILLRAETEIGPEETAGELFDRLMALGAELLDRTLTALADGTLSPIPQNDEEASYAPMLSKDMAKLDWTRSAGELHDLIRGLNPWPCAETVLEGKRLKLLSSRVEAPPSGRLPAAGEAFAENGELYAGCGQGVLRITGLQTENGKRMGGREYLVGHPIGEDARFG